MINMSSYISKLICDKSVILVLCSNTSMVREGESPPRLLKTHLSMLIGSQTTSNKPCIPQCWDV